MKRLLTLLLLLCAAINLNAQTQYFGQIDTTDLKLTLCDFEKDANAMVLFDKTDVNTEFLATTVSVYKRIKIFNKKGAGAADVVIEYFGKDNLERISDVQAQTINFDNHHIVVTPVNAAQIYKQTVDKFTKKVTFSFPAIKAGSVIEYSYTLIMDYEGGMPDWDFQGNLPVRYSEFNAKIIKDFTYAITARVHMDYDKNTKEPMLDGSNVIQGNNYVWAVKNVPSFNDEAFSTGMADNVQGINFQLSSIHHPTHREYQLGINTWEEMARGFLSEPQFGGQIIKDLDDDDKIIAAAKLLPSDAERINYIFGKIKAAVKWNGINALGSADGVKKAWDKKLGSNAEINFILLNFLRQAGFKCSAVLVSTRAHGKVNAARPDLRSFNKVVVGVTTANKAYVLDANDKFTPIGNIPVSLLNTTSFWLDPVSKAFVINVLKDTVPSRQAVVINAHVKADGKLEGTTHINRFSYDRISSIEKFEELGEAKYKELLKNNDNNLKILAFKRENVETDTLPLTETIDFQLDLSNGDENYLFINPNLFTTIHSNPFLSESRNAGIDFGSLNIYSIKGLYKLPAGYKTESVPKAISLTMPDTSITFKRAVFQEEGSILVNYTINFKKTIFTADEYPGIRDFYKKMFEMLNEQIVLKKL